jgi:hypothetical protein
MNQVTEPVSIPFPTLSPAHAERIHLIATEIPYKYGVEIIELIKALAMEQYKASQSVSEVEEVK